MKKYLILFIIIFGCLAYADSSGGNSIYDNFFFDTGWMFRQKVGHVWYNEELFLKNNQIENSFNYKKLETCYDGGLKGNLDKIHYFKIASEAEDDNEPLDSSYGFGTYIEEVKSYKYVEDVRSICCEWEENECFGNHEDEFCKIVAEIEGWWKNCPGNVDKSVGIPVYYYTKDIKDDLIRGNGVFEFEIPEKVNSPIIEVVSCVGSSTTVELCKDDVCFGEFETRKGNWEEYFKGEKEMCPLIVYGASMERMERVYADCPSIRKQVYEGDLIYGKFKFSLVSNFNSDGIAYSRCLLRIIDAQKDDSADKPLMNFNCFDYPRSQCGFFNKKFVFYKDDSGEVFDFDNIKDDYKKNKEGLTRWIDGIWYPRGGGERGSGEYEPEKDCTEKWTCGSWGSCINGIQKRNCVLRNKDEIDGCKEEGLEITEVEILKSRLCNGNFVCVDSDGDGEFKIDGCATGTDCDDTDSDINSGAEEVCDGLDNDCDFVIDENCVEEDDYIPCDNGALRECGTNFGNCNKGIQVCDNGFWSSCGGGYVGAVSEICDGLDNDCDGYVDEGVCEECVSDKECGSDLGVCSKGIVKCINGVFGSVCEGEVSPVSEICDDGLDNDCDGLVDNEDDGCFNVKGSFFSEGLKESCFDGIKNQDETGIDCGGICVPCESFCFGGLITSECRCGSANYSSGYCCDGIYSEVPCGEEEYVADFVDFDISEEPSKSNWIWLLLIIVFISCFVFVYYYFFLKKNKPRTVSKRKKAVKKELNSYVKKKPLIKESEIRKYLGFGKSSGKISKKPLNDYVSKMIKNGMNTKEIEKGARRAGWKVEDIKKAIKSHKR